MNMKNLTGTPLVAAIIVSGAVLVLVGISVSFSGNVMF